MGWKGWLFLWLLQTPGPVHASTCSQQARVKDLLRAMGDARLVKSQGAHICICGFSPAWSARAMACQNHRAPSKVSCSWLLVGAGHNHPESVCVWRVC